MAVKIRLRRIGNRNRPFYRMVAVDARRGTSGRYIENLGWYNPAVDGLNFNLKLDRVSYWEGVGAIPSDSARSIIKKARKYQPEQEAPAPEPDVESTELTDNMVEGVKEAAVERVEDVEESVDEVKDEVDVTDEVKEADEGKTPDESSKEAEK